MTPSVFKHLGMFLSAHLIMQVKLHLPEAGPGYLLSTRSKPVIPMETLASLSAAAAARGNHSLLTPQHLIQTSSWDHSSLLLPWEGPESWFFSQ